MKENPRLLSFISFIPRGFLLLASFFEKLYLGVDGKQTWKYIYLSPSPRSTTKHSQLATRSRARSPSNPALEFSQLHKEQVSAPRWEWDLPRSGYSLPPQPAPSPPPSWIPFPVTDPIRRASCCLCACYSRFTVASR